MCLRARCGEVLVCDVVTDYLRDGGVGVFVTYPKLMSYVCRYTFLGGACPSSSCASGAGLLELSLSPRSVIIRTTSWAGSVALGRAGPELSAGGPGVA